MAGNNFALGAAENKMDLQEKDNFFCPLLFTFSVLPVSFLHVCCSYLAEREKIPDGPFISNKITEERNSG